MLNSFTAVLIAFCATFLNSRQKGQLVKCLKCVTSFFLHCVGA